MTIAMKSLRVKNGLDSMREFLTIAPHLVMESSKDSRGG